MEISSQFNINNIGSLSLEVSGIISNSGVFEVSGVTFPLNIEPDGYDTFSVVFNSEVEVNHSGIISMYTNSLQQNPFIFNTLIEFEPKTGYIIGGQYGDVNAVYEYDTPTDNWSTGVSRNAGGVASFGTSIRLKGYTVGGLSVDVLSEYDKVTTSWDAKTPYPDEVFYNAFFAIETNLYVGGGAYGGLGATDITNKYDTGLDSWEVKSSLSAKRSSMGSVTLRLKGFSFGGQAYGAAFDENLDINEKYDPNTDVWTIRQPMPDASRYMATFAISAKGYAIAGWTGISPISRYVRRYDDSVDTWTQMALHLTFRNRLAGFQDRTKGYTVGGWGESKPVGSDETQEYNLSTDSWTFMQVNPDYNFDSASFSV